MAVRRDWYVVMLLLFLANLLCRTYTMLTQWLHALQVSCVKSSQGFDWNQGEKMPTLDMMNAFAIRSDISTELFLPSYADYEAQDLERKQDPVEEIVLTDEEVAAMFPQ